MNDSLVTANSELRAINGRCQSPLYPDGLDDPGLLSAPAPAVDEEPLHDAHKTEPSECHSSPTPLNLSVPCTTAPTVQQLNSDNRASLARLEVTDPPPSYYTMGPSLMDHLTRKISCEHIIQYPPHSLPARNGVLVSGFDPHRTRRNPDKNLCIFAQTMSSPEGDSHRAPKPFSSYCRNSPQ
jgi:hypothetical protein